MVWNKVKQCVVYGVLTLYVVVFFLFFFQQEVYATVYLSRVSDLLTMSAPGATTNHTIRFTLVQAIPANGAIEVSFSEGGSIIPAGLNYTDVDLAFSAVPGGPYTDRPLSSVQSPGTDDVTVTAGATGALRFDLNTTIGIPAGSEVVIEIGSNATYGAVGDVRMQNAFATGSYPVTIRTYDVTDTELDYGRTVVALVEQVTLGPVDTTDQTPPVILLAEPTGILQVGTRAVQMYVVTDEFSSCRYATSSMTYASMPYSLYGTTSGLALRHFAQINGLEDDTEYLYYLRCIDYRMNEIDPDYELTFTVGITPGSATTTSTSTGGTSGTGVSTTTATSGPGTGDDIGTGDGPTGSGTGDGPVGGDGGGSGSGGSGGSGSATSLPQADVRIRGWGYPNSTVTVFRDGTVLGTEGVDGSGAFSFSDEGLDRGSYTYGVYATDSKGVRSSTFSTTLWLRSETTNSISNVMLAPTVSIANRSVNPGELLFVEGYSVPNAKITASLRPKLAEVSVADVVATTSVSNNGTWSITLPTSGLTTGTYEFVAQASMNGGEIESDKSIRNTVGVGVSVNEADGDCLSVGDLNCDGAVNLVDFSILLFNWNTPNDIADINSDGIVSLPDFSIMLYNWTG